MLELPKFEQRHWDLIGLALVAFAAFFACVFYLGWAGGRVGEAMGDGILFLFGAVGYLAPVALFAVGALLVVRPMIRQSIPSRRARHAWWARSRSGSRPDRSGSAPATLRVTASSIRATCANTAGWSESRSSGSRQSCFPRRARTSSSCS